MKKYILGDCMDHLVNYKDNHFDLAVVDPPYGIDICSSPRIVTDKGIESKKWDIKPTKEYFKQLLRVSKNQIIWGWNYFTNHLPTCRGFVFWNKDVTVKNFGGGELAFTSFDRVCQYYYYAWNGLSDGVLGRNKKQKNIHPTQKPVALYRWILQNYAKPNDLILDTHVGSASSLIACHMEGFDYVGFEKDEDYFRDSTKRLQQHLSQIRMF